MTKRSNLRMSCRKCHCECKIDGFDITVLTPSKEMNLNPKIKQHLSFKTMTLD